jgi:anti-anti-sigma factor
MKGLEVDVQTTDDVAVATLTGELDLLNCEEAGDRLLAEALASSGGIVIDLTDVRYVDSNAIRVLFALARNLAQSRVPWAVALSESSPVRRLFKITTFDEVVPLLPSVEEAIAALAD